MPGLSSGEAAELKAKGLTNERVDPSTSTVGQIIRSNVFTYFNLIFVMLAVLVLITGEFKNLTFMLIVIANTVTGIAQEIRSKQVLDRLRLLKMPKSHVLRDGMETTVPVEELVLYDVVILRGGNQVPADAEVLDGSVQVNEALVTGEADEVTKEPGSELLSGSFIVSGQCAAVLTAVGRDSYISKLTLEATRDKGTEQSEMIRSLDKLVKVIGVLIIPVGIILFSQQSFILGGSFYDSITSMVAAVLGMIPEGLYMTASIAMVVGAVRLAQKDVLVQNMRSIETLARVNVLCVDKTGTITENQMKVSKVEQVSRAIREDYLYVLIGDLVFAQNADNSTMTALKEYFTERSGRSPVFVCPFSSEYKYCGAVFDDGNFVLGAPEFVLGDQFYKYENRIEQAGEEGYRVLALAMSENIPDGSFMLGEVRLLALIYLNNPVRKNARETFGYFAENGVEIKVISGDNPVTASKAAQEAGIENSERYIDARQLVTERLIGEALKRYTVFGRVTPEQKRMFVKALQKQGKTVGMTGDGVNDILALRDADCSVALASGSEAASNAAQLVLMDSDFSRMPSVVDEGRRVVNNIEKSASLYLTKNIFSLLLALFSMVSVLSYPLKPSQITLISLFTIGIPSLVLSLEPNRQEIRGSFFGSVFKMAAPAGITTFISVSSLVIFGRVFEIRQEFISTACTMLVALVGFMILGKVAKPASRFHAGLIAIMFAGMAYCIFFQRQLFGIDHISTQTMMLLIVFLIATEAVFRYLYKFAGLCGNIIGRGEKGKKNKS